MKRTIIAAMLLCTLICNTASAKRQPVAHMYMFGLAASFTDTIVHLTPIQTLDSVWIDTKNDFLQERQEYSAQMRNYLDKQQQMPRRTCIVFYNQKKEKLQKKYDKIVRLYTKGKDGKKHFDLRLLTNDMFHFTTIDLSAYADDSQPTTDGTEESTTE